MVTVTCVEKGSLAEKAGILVGDGLLSLNGHPIRDVLDYRFYLADRSLSVVCEREGASHSFHIDKGEYEDIGLDFETPLMDGKKT